MRRCFVQITLSIVLLLASSHASSQLYELTAANGKIGFLFGTVHDSKPGVDTIPTPLIEAISLSRLVVLETAEPLSIASRQKQLGLADGLTILDVLPERLQGCVRDIYLEMLQASNFEPAISSLFTIEVSVFSLAAVDFIVNDQRPTGKNDSFDREISKIARTQRKIIANLESPSEKINVLRRISLPDSIALLNAVCETRVSESRRSEVMKTHAQVVATYVAHDPARLASLYRGFYRQLGVSDQFDKIFWTARNGQMANRIAGLLSRGFVPFIAIGASHLGGSDGVLALLKEHGVTVTSANFDHQQ